MSKLFSAPLLLVLLASSASFADNVPLPPEQAYAQLGQLVVAEPENLQYRFDYAQAAFQLGKYDEAEQIYAFMLERDPSLDRVKLELAMTKFRMGQLEPAKSLLEEVKAKNPPEQVKKNIEMLAKAIDKEIAPNKFQASVTVGANYDTNANSSSSSVLFGDVRIPLTGSTGEKSDTHYYSALAAEHNHRFGGKATASNNKQVLWNTGGTLYATEQVNLNNINLYFGSIKTGPELRLKDKKLSVGSNLAYTYLMLDGYEYLNLPSLEVWGTYGLTSRIALNFSGTYEVRQFENSPSISTHKDRSGDAWQMRVGSNIALTEKDLVSTILTWRKESTKQNYLDNKQYDMNISYMRVINPKWLATLGMEFRKTDYGGFDIFVSSVDVRSDRERTLSAGIGYRIRPNITWNFGGMLTSVNSAIVNYKYDNRRLSTSVNYSF